MAHHLRILVACDACQRQYDASHRSGGSRFHCSCGELVTVPQAAKAHDAAVVRCSSCGGTREAKEEACGFCGSDFTLHERDLHTVCPSCTARISDLARYCHFCATAIVPQGSAGESTKHGCPKCGSDTLLASRSLGGERLTVLECGRCGGLWLGSGVFELLEQRAQSMAASGEVLGMDHRPHVITETTEGCGPFYRPCPLCGKLMHRRNYSSKSGVIVDTCKQHGIWFDQGELDAILRWIKAGGLAKAQEQTRRKLEQAQREQSHGRSTAQIQNSSYILGSAIGGSLGLDDFIGGIIDLL